MSPCQSHMPLSLHPLLPQKFGWGVMGHKELVQYSKQNKKSCTAFENYQHFECFRALMTPKKNTISGVVPFKFSLSLLLFFLCNDLWIIFVRFKVSKTTYCCNILVFKEPFGRWDVLCNDHRFQIYDDQIKKIK